MSYDHFILKETKNLSSYILINFKTVTRPCMSFILNEYVLSSLAAWMRKKTGTEEETAKNAENLEERK